MKILVPIASAVLVLGFTSCGSSSSVTAVKEMKRGDIARFSFRDLLPSGVPVVEVREKDLKEIKLGKDKALAYQRKRGGFSSWFGKPVDYKEPELPSGEIDNPEYGLLPPKAE